MTSVASQFHVPPFPPYPSAERYVAVGSQEETLKRVARAVEVWEAISLVIGPPGTGKSLISQVLQKQFSGSREVVVLGDAMLESPQTLLSTLLNRLDRKRGDDFRGSPTTVVDPQLALAERISASGPNFPGLLLLVDEAQSLSPEVLEMLRILTNTMKDGRPQVSAVLLGGPSLDETLALPSLEPLVQRVATRCYLHPLSSDETVQYVRSVIRACGAPPEDSIDEAAIRNVHRACSGVPRLINHLMTTAIDYAASKGDDRINEGTIDQAWAILQQLPSPIVDEPELKRPEPAPVEFAPLSTFEASTDEEGTVEEPTLAEISAEETATEESLCDNDCDGCECGPDRDAIVVIDDEDDLEVIAELDEAFEEEELGLAQESEEQELEPVCEEPAAASEELFNEDTWVNESYTVQNFAEDADERAYSAVSIDCQSFTTDEDRDPKCESKDETVRLTTADVSIQQEITPSGEELFGQFDAEEEIEVSAATASLDHLENSSSELERSLHNEILSLRGEAADGLSSAEVVPPTNQLKMHGAADQPSAPALWMDEEATTEPVDDDRDMLVIEDDIRVEDAVLVHESVEPETEATPVAVDFQSMLAKMRRGNG